MSIIKRYRIKNPPMLEEKDLFKKDVYDYNEMLGFYLTIYEWKLDFDNIIICVKSERKCNIHSFWDLRRHLISKIEYFERQGYKFSHICENNITFI